MTAAVPALVLLLAIGCGQGQGHDPAPQVAPAPRSSAMPPAPDPVPAIHNDDLSWDGNFAGLVPTIRNPATAAMVEAATPTTAALVALLADPDRFAIAHVLLTRRQRGSFTIDGSRWNGLHVELAASGAVTYDRRDLPALQRQWAAALAR